VSRNLESVPRLFHVPGMGGRDLADFGPAPSAECLVSLARGLRDVANWGQVELRPTREWVVYTPLSAIVALLILAAMVLLSALLPVSSLGTGGLVSFFIALATQWPFYLVCIAFFMLLSASRPSGIVEAALPSGLHSGNLEESLAEAHDPFERIRLFLDVLPPDDQKGLLEATHYALWKTLRASRTGLKRRSRSTEPS